MRTYLTYFIQLFESNVRAIGLVHVYIRKSYVQSIVVYPSNYIMKENYILYNIPILRCWVKDKNL